MGRVFALAILVVTALNCAVSVAVCADPPANSAATPIFPEPEPPIDDWTSLRPSPDPNAAAATQPARRPMLFYGPNRSASSAVSEMAGPTAPASNTPPASPSQQRYLDARRRQQLSQPRQQPRIPVPQSHTQGLIPPEDSASRQMYLEARQRQMQSQPRMPQPAPRPARAEAPTVDDTASVTLFDEARRRQAQSQSPRRSRPFFPQSPRDAATLDSDVAPLAPTAVEQHEAIVERQLRSLPQRSLPTDPPLAPPQTARRSQFAPPTAPPQVSHRQLAPPPSVAATRPPNEAAQPRTAVELFDEARRRQGRSQPPVSLPAPAPPRIAASAEPSHTVDLEQFDAARQRQMQSRPNLPAPSRMAPPQAVVDASRSEPARTPQSRAELYEAARRRESLSHERHPLPSLIARDDVDSEDASHLATSVAGTSARGIMGKVSPLGDLRPDVAAPTLEPPFTDDMPPIVQVGHEESRQIARPMFNELLEESSSSNSILQTGLEFPAWDAVRSWSGPSYHNEDCEECWDNPWKRLFCFGIHKHTPDIGIGQERVALAGFEIDASQPFNNVRVRYDSVYGLPFPDRSLWFWAKSGNGPASAGEVVNYQDFRVYSEIGNKSASAIVEYPLRSLDPEINGNTTGFGDMVVGNKAVIVDGRYWQITQVFRTYVNTGNVKT